MSRIENTSKIKIYSKKRTDKLVIHSHWTKSDLVELEIEGRRHCVCGAALIMAVKNCLNVDAN